MALPFLSREETALLSVLPLFHPTLTHLVYESWNDLTVAFFLALFVCFFLARRLTLSYLALAMTFALKQYSVVFFFPFLFILNKRDIRLWLAAIMIIILPLASYAVWDPTAFSESVIMFQVRQPFRADASNIPALLDHLFHIRPLEGLGYPLLLVIQTALSLACSFYVRSKNIIARSKDKLRFVLHISIMQFFTFVFFSKQAFGNYYYLLISMLYLGLLVSVEGEKLTNPLSPSTMPREERRMTTTTGQKKCLAARIKARAAVILSLALLSVLSAAAQDIKPSADGFYLAVSGQSLGFKGDFNGSLVLWHFEMAFFVPALKSATAAGFGLGYKRDGWQWEILYIGSGHRAVLPDREVDSSFHSIELDSRTFLVRDFPLKPYLLLGLSIPWLNVDSGSELYGVRYNAAYIGFGVNLGAGLQWDIAPFLFVNAGTLYRLIGYYYVSGEGKGRDITELHVGHEGPTWKSWLKTSSLGVMFGVGLVF